MNRRMPLVDGSQKQFPRVLNILNCSCWMMLIPKEDEPYEFPCTLFSGGGNSVKYMRIGNCLMMPPIGFSGFKKLTILVLEQLVVEQDLLQCLFSNSFHLDDLTLKSCYSSTDLRIVSPTLHHLKIFKFHQQCHRKIDIVELNLLSLEYNGTCTISLLDAPHLLEFCLECYYIMPPVEFSVFKMLRTLVLELLLVEQDRLLCFLSECFSLEELTIVNCNFESDMHVISPTLSHLKIIYCDHYPRPWKIHIDTLNLSSFDYGGEIRLFFIKAPQLLKAYMNATGLLLKKYHVPLL